MSGLDDLITWLGTRPDLVIVAGFLLMICLVLLERLRATD